MRRALPARPAASACRTATTRGRRPGARDARRARRAQLADVQRLAAVGAPEVDVAELQAGVARQQHVRRLAPRRRADLDRRGADAHAAEQADAHPRLHRRVVAEARRGDRASCASQRCTGATRNGQPIASQTPTTTTSATSMPPTIQRPAHAGASAACERTRSCDRHGLGRVRTGAADRPRPRQRAGPAPCRQAPTLLGASPRAPGPRVERGRRRAPFGAGAERGDQVVGREVRHRAARRQAGAGDVRRQHDVGHRRAGRGGPSARPRTRRARRRRCACSRSACASAASSTMPPRAMLVSVAVGFISASSAAPIRWCDCGAVRHDDDEVVGLAQQLVLADVARAELGLDRRRRAASGCDRSPSCRSRARRAARSPGRCGPCRGCRASRRARRCRRTGRRSTSSTRRGAGNARSRRCGAPSAIISAKPKSAVVSVSTSGALLTSTPRAVQAGTSMLL